MMHTDLTKRLPSELLTMIFLAWKHLYGSQQHGIAAEWVRASWVCRTWREVALEAATLWSSILVSRRLADDPALKLQLDRAHGVAVNVMVSLSRMSEAELEEVFRFVLSKTKFVRQLQITFDAAQETIVKGFVQDAGTEVVSLSLIRIPSGSDDDLGWKFTSDLFPRLRHLALDRITPSPGAPLPTLIHLSLAFAYDFEQYDRVHIFLAGFPNLESLLMERCFILDEDNSLRHDQLVISLPKLRYLSVEDTVFEIATSLSPFRLPSLASFHILADCEGNVDGDFTIYVLPRNISEVLPAFRHTRCLSLKMGHPTNHVLFRGSAGDTFEDGPDWSITMPDLTSRPSSSPTAYFEAAHFYYLGHNGERFLEHIPNLVDASHLVELQLHFAHGLPVAVYWAQFFAPMSHLRTLGIGGGTLVAAVLAAFRADTSLCEELQDVALCAPAGCQWVRDGTRLLLFFRKVVGGWVRKRARAGTGLRSLTVRMLEDGSESGSSYARTHAGGDSDSLDAGLAACPGTSDVNSALIQVGLASKLRKDLVWLEDLVDEVTVEDADCPACSAVYELPADPESSDEDMEGSNDDEQYFY